MRKVISLVLAAAVVGMSNLVYAEEANYTVNEDFESYTIGTPLKDVHSDWDIKDSTDGDSVTIEEDPYTQSKAVKIKQKKQAVSKNSNPETGFKVKFDKFTSGSVEVSFKIRQENATALFNQTFVRGTTSKVGVICNYRSNLYLNGMSKHLAALDASKYSEIKFVIDIDNGKYTASSKTGTTEESIDVRATVDDVSAIEFYIAANYGDGAVSWIDPELTGDAVYWVDDIKVMQKVIAIESITPANENTDVSIDDDIEVTFNTEPKLESLREETKVYANGEEVSNELYSISVNDKVMTLSFVDGMEYNTEYEIEFSKKVAPVDTAYMTLGSEHSFKFTTERLFPALSVKEVYAEASITLPRVDGVTITATIEDEEGNVNPYTSQSLITALGKYKLTVVSENDTNHKKQTDEYEFDVVGLVIPVASEVNITSDDSILERDSVLKGNYVFSDINEDQEGESIYKWYCSNTKDGKYTEIEGANTTEYELGGDDVNKYFKFSVTPVSVNEPSVGVTVESEPVPGFFLPIAERLSITGEVCENGILRALYFYHDENGTPEGETTYQWYRSFDGGKNYTPIANATEYNYTLTDDDIGALIRFGIIPKKSTAEGLECFSEPVAGLNYPEARNITIEGDARVDRSVYVSYTFFDDNGDAEGETQINWYCDGKVISTDKSIKITKDIKGKSIYVEVTPVSTKYPYIGKSVSSNKVTVSGDQVKSNGGGGSSAGGIFSEVKKETEEKKDNPVVVPEKKGFIDISGHWAEDVIKKMFDKGIVNGVDEKHFSPNSTVTRAQFASMINNLLALENTDSKIEFTDVDSSAWYYNPISLVTRAGFMSGYNNSFRPNDNITREEMCVVTLNIVKQKGKYQEAQKGAEFTDYDAISDWAKQAVDFASGNGIIMGRDNGEFQPKSNATRAESLVILDRLSKLLNAEENDLKSSELLEEEEADEE